MTPNCPATDAYSSNLTADTVLRDLERLMTSSDKFCKALPSNPVVLATLSNPLLKSITVCLLFLKSKNSPVNTEITTPIGEIKNLPIDLPNSIKVPPNSANAFPPPSASSLIDVPRMLSDASILA
ncbi:hypothetical protein D3C86_1332570 [compost metagenome]